MFRRNKQPIPDIEKDPEAFRAWEDKMFTWKIYVPSPEGYSSMTDPEFIEEMRAEGRTDEEILDSPNKVAELLMRSAEQRDVIAPPYGPVNSE